MKTILAAALVAFAALALLGAPASADAAPKWVKIQGKSPMKAAKKLKYRIACSEACKVSVTSKLMWPNRPNLVNTIKGTFQAGESRANILTLNGPARNTLKANYRQARLKVIVRAKSLERGVKRTVRRTFKFKR